METALNYSAATMFPAHVSEDNLVSPLRVVNGYLVEDVPEMNGQCFGRPWHGGRDMNECFDCGRKIESCYGGAKIDRRDSPDPGSSDVVDLLPSDPFGMDISSTVTAITGWLQDLDFEYGGGYGRSNLGSSKEDFSLFEGLNFFWNNTMRLQSFPSSDWQDPRLIAANKVICNPGGTRMGEALAQDSFGSVRNGRDIVGFNNTSGSPVSPQREEKVAGGGACFEGDGVPHEALSYALNFLGVKDLLSVERVCRSLCSTVRNDPLLWRSVHIGQPLNEKVTDDVLLQLTSRAQGNLRCLRLVECPRITEDCLRRVLDANPRLTKLCVPGCTRLSIEGIVNIVKAFNTNKGRGCMGIKHLRIGGLYGVTHDHFQELKLLLGVDSQISQAGQKPHFYHQGNFYLLCDDDRAIDVEECPKCQKLRLVYDCPAEGCQVKDQSTQACRACTLCIARCVQCGRCVNDSEYEETFCLDLLCADCYNQIPKYQDVHDNNLDPAADDVISELSNGFALCG